MNTVLQNKEEEMAIVGRAKGGARYMPRFDQDGQDVLGNGFASAKVGETCCGEELKPFWLEDGRYGAVCRKCGQQFADNTQVRYGGSPWIGVDLDGTLARDLGGTRGDEIGSPIEPMLTRVQKWIAEGRTVKIFTARASSPRQVMAIKEWLASCGLPDLEVTNVKDQRMIELWDDRCVQVTTNLGEPIGKKAGFRHPRQVRMPQEDRQGISFGFFNRLRILLAL
ncbi:MAG: hypothetical protein ABSF10_18445 [Verrucomicrobiota bacterium]|jgi:hypothetical protein